MPLIVAAAAVAVVTDVIVVVGFIVTFIKKRSNIRMRSVYIKSRAHVFRNLHIEESSEDSIPFCHASMHTYIYIDCTTLTAPLIHLHICIGAARAHTDVRIHIQIYIYIYLYIVAMF